jgi:hypothetical protein
VAVVVVRIVLFVVSVVCCWMSFRCLRDARKGGDFGQVYSWAFGSAFGVASLAAFVLMCLL